MSKYLLDERKEKILKAIIDDYILTGIPVGSRTLSKKADINVSPATIRNDMSDLEDFGYLTQPYTSAGRIPSDRAYRLYVDKLMPIARLSKGEAKIIDEIFDNKMIQINEMIEKTAEAISKATNQISVVLAPQLRTAKVRRIQLVRLSGIKVLVLIITSTGMVKQKIIKTTNDVNENYLEMISHMLTEYLEEKPLMEANRIIETVFKDEIRGHEKLFKSLISSIKDTAFSDIKKDIILGGANNIFNHPEYQDINRAKDFLQVLETKDVLYDMLNRQSGVEFSISIGNENTCDQMKDCSVVSATYKIGDHKLGSFGVIGPTRMNYAKVVTILDHVGKSLNDILDGFVEDDE